MKKDDVEAINVSIVDGMANCSQEGYKLHSHGKRLIFSGQVMQSLARCMHDAGLEFPMTDEGMDGDLVEALDKLGKIAVKHGLRYS